MSSMNELMYSARFSEDESERIRCGMELVRRCISNSRLDYLEVIGRDSYQHPQVREYAGMKLCEIYSSMCDYESLVSICENEGYLMKVREYSGMKAIENCCITDDIFELSRLSISCNIPRNIKLMAKNDLKKVGMRAVDNFASRGDKVMLVKMCRNIALPRKVRNAASIHISVNDMRMVGPSLTENEFNDLVGVCSNSLIPEENRVIVGVKLVENCIFDGKYYLLNRLLRSDGIPGILKNIVANAINEIAERSQDDFNITKDLIRPEAVRKRKHTT